MHPSLCLKAHNLQNNGGIFNLKNENVALTMYILILLTTVAAGIHSYVYYKLIRVTFGAERVNQFQDNSC